MSVRRAKAESKAGTSWAKSRKSRRMEKSAGSVHPLLSMKNRKNKLVRSSKILCALATCATYETSADCSLKASPGRRRAIWVHIRTYWIAISSQGLIMLPLKCASVAASKTRQSSFVGSTTRLTVGERNPLTRSFPWGLVGRKRYARLGPFSAFRASLICVKKVEKSIGILGTNSKLKMLEIQWDQSYVENASQSRT